MKPASHSVDGDRPRLWTGLVGRSPRATPFRMRSLSIGTVQYEDRPLTKPFRMTRVLPLLLLLVATQVPAVPGEGTLVSFCKQGRLSACQELAKIAPEKAARLQADLAKTALSGEAL